MEHRPAGMASTAIPAAGKPLSPFPLCMHLQFYSQQYYTSCAGPGKSQHLPEKPLRCASEQDSEPCLTCLWLLHAQALGIDATEEIHFGEPYTTESMGHERKGHWGPEAAQLPNGDAHANHIPTSNGNKPFKVNRGCW